MFGDPPKDLPGDSTIPHRQQRNPFLKSQWKSTDRGKTILDPGSNFLLKLKSASNFIPPNRHAVDNLVISRYSNMKLDT